MEEVTLSSKSDGKYSEKGSTFFALAFPVSDAAGVKTILQQLKEQYPNASHICYGYRIKVNNQLDEFATDAGEPKGSSGIPIINVLKRKHLVNVVIFVIRYFGGNKLGIPGLIHAYGRAAENAIETGNLKKWILYQQISICYNYDLQKKVDSLFQQFAINIIKIEFGESIKTDLEVEVEKSEALAHDLREISNGAIRMKQIS